MSGITLTQMQHVLTTEAERIGIVQHDLVASGILKAPDPGNMQIKATLEASCRLVAMVASDPMILKRVGELARHAKRAATEVAS